VVFVSGTSAKPAELWLYTPGHPTLQLTHFNKAFEKIPLGLPELIKYKSFDGTTIEAQLYTPANQKAGPLPMIVFIHGGPTGAFEDNYSAWPQLFLQKGYAVMMPNIRGSTGYGWKFLEANRNDWGGADFKDIMAGIDYGVANKNIDSARLAIVGWSYGGYMSEWAITQTNRFKAAMSGAGLFNLASEFGTEGGAAYDHWFLGTPYGNSETYAKHSAITFIKNAHTPTLIIQGEDDNVDPIGQSEELYRALRYYDVPAKLVLYPHENHGFVNLKHSIDFYTRMLDWIGKYCPASK
jgi:dipeptidyl aminopeptidase/acylaminoacyl peptidase